jgi:SAM-dependent methyltransferase
MLDWGCGTGSLTGALVPHYPQVHGYDPSPESLRVARDRVPGATFHEHVADVPNESFGSAVVSGVLHHVPRAERKDMLVTVRDKLSSGGRLFVFEHNPLNPVTRHVVRVCPFDVDVELVYPWHARRLLVDAGFRDVAVKYIVFFPRALRFLRSLEPKLDWLPLGGQIFVTGTR